MADLEQHTIEGFTIEHAGAALRVNVIALTDPQTGEEEGYDLWLSGDDPESDAGEQHLNKNDDSFDERPTRDDIIEYLNENFPNGFGA